MGGAHKQDEPSAAKLCNLFFAATMVGLSGATLKYARDGRFQIYYMEAPAPEERQNPDGIVMPLMTEGSCLVDIQPQEDGFLQSWCDGIEDNPPNTTIWGNAKYPACYPLGVPEWHPTDNIVVTLPEPSECDVAVSDSWQIAGWHTTYIQLGPNAVFNPPRYSSSAQYMAKLNRGSLLDVGRNGILRGDGRWETFVVTPPLTARSLHVPHTADAIQAGPNGAAFTWLVAPVELLETPVTSMTSGPASMISGPYSDLLRWRTFADATGDATFANFWNLAGILLQNSDGSRLCFNQWWTTREDDPVDGGYHDHTGAFFNNTFAELHVTMYAATASAGMQSHLPHTMNLRTMSNPADASSPPQTQSDRWYEHNDDPETQLVVPMPPGYVHGPLWAVDPRTGNPRMNCRGGVVYPWHRLVTGTDGDSTYHNPPRYQLWVVFEHPPQYASVPQQMLAKWTNAYLQNEDGNYPDDCVDSSTELPPLRDNICDLNTIYDQIRTGNVVEQTLDIRRRDCPSDRHNQPCGFESATGFNPGPFLDGVRSPVYTINDGSPGPTIRANLGDTIRVTVNNYIGEPTTVHFHGITQFGTPHADGDELVSNCPIAFGQSYTYEFIAHPAGSTFYHSHVGSQRQMGMQGALIIVDPNEEQQAVDRELLIQDWFHLPADHGFNFWAQNTAPSCVTFGGPRFTGYINEATQNYPGAVVGDGMLYTSMLVNGRGIYDWNGTQIPKDILMTNPNSDANGEDPRSYEDQFCPGQTPEPPECQVCLDPSTGTSGACAEGESNSGLCGQVEIIEITQGQTARLRLIEAASLFAFQVCIDAHPVNVVAADGQPTTPLPVDCVLLAPGERYDVLLEADKPPGDYAIRFTTTEQKVFPDLTFESGAAFGPDTEGFPGYGIAVLRYTGAPTSGSSILDPPACTTQITRNCGPDYWLAARTMGCAMGPSADEPDRCISAFDLQPAAGGYPDQRYCGGMIMGHEVAPDVRISTILSFVPDQVPRPEGWSLNTRMEIVPEDRGWPYVTNPADFGVQTPISFIAPPQPTLSLPKEDRDQLYAFREVVRPSDPNNPGELPPNYPEGFSAITQGPNSLSVEYGDVVRVFMNCTEPFGPGCAMPHPMHLHGNKMAVVAYGRWNEPFDESMINPNPLYRDTVTAHTDGWVVVQFVAKNPGVWRFHCHVNIHHRSGMAMLFDVGGTNAAAMAMRQTPPELDLCSQEPIPNVDTSAVSPSETGGGVSTQGDGGGTDGGGQAGWDLAGIGVGSSVELSALSNNICDLDTVYDQIITGNVVEQTLDIRRRDCPSDRHNQPCGFESATGFNPGPFLDGVRAPVYTINDSSPGPTIRANLGDTIRVTVNNYIGEAVTMHFHGITQFRTPYADGDEMVSNCPIPFGQSYTYEFIAHPAGSTFYHSHVGSQRQLGMQGALIIVDPNEEQQEVDRELLIQDWFHLPADAGFLFWAQNAAPNCVTFGGPRLTGALNPAAVPRFVGAVVGDGMLYTSMLVNGRGTYSWSDTQIPKDIMRADGDGSDPLNYEDQLCPGQTAEPPECQVCLDPTTGTSGACAEGASDTGVCGQVEIIEITQGQTARLRLIEAASLFAFQVCVDAHPVSVIAADGQPTTPLPADCVVVSPGERYDVLLEADMPPGDYAIRFTTTEQKVEPEFSGTDTNYPNDFGPDTEGFPNQGIAILRYTGSVPSGRSILDPPACTTQITRNCGPSYWLASRTMGCAMEPSADEPDRCISAFDLQPAAGGYPDQRYCGGMIMGHEVAPDVRISTILSFLPDQVPRWENYHLNTRMEIVPEDRGWPYVTNPDDLGSQRPIGFVAPPQPPLSLPREDRDRLYSFREIVRNPDPSNPGELPPNYPEGFSAVEQGPNTLSVEYGDIVRIFVNCTEPFGPGCAMPHPMHLHGNKMAVVAYGRWNEPFDESMINPNPVYRDTVVAHTDGWFVVQFVAKNPGVWRFHCHVNIHHRSGMAMLFDVGGTNEAAMAARETPPELDLCPLSTGSDEDGSSGSTEGSSAELPTLSNNICDLDTIYDQIRTGNVVEEELSLRRRDCPSDRHNQPCGVESAAGFSPGPFLDGVRAPVITINDSSPGPTIRANLGDTIRVTVSNYIGEPVTMHFHGITQFRTPHADGDEMVSNCPIPFGQSYTYEFIAHPAGSTFFHSHVGSQRQLGMQGALIIVDPNEEQEEVDRELLIQDWWHDTADQAFNFWAQNVPPGGYCITFGGPRFTGPINPAGPIPNFVGAVVGDGMTFNSVLINGRGQYDWAGTQIPKDITLESGQTFDDMLCPGQYPEPKDCEICLDTDSWTSSQCTEGTSSSGICGQVEIIEVQSGQLARLRLIQAATLYAFQVCIDAHPVSVVAADGQPTIPYPIDCVVIAPGERYDVLLQADRPVGDYAIRFLTTEQKVSADFSGTDADYPNDYGANTAGFPNQGIAILRYTGSANPGSSLMDPPACSTDITRNCGPDYWLTSTSIGCAMGPSIDDPDRCISAFDLEPLRYPDADYCGNMGMGHEVEPNVRISTPLSFFPDEVPRWEGRALNSRMEIIPEEDGWPYVTPVDNFGYHQPVAFVAPPEPTLSLTKDMRDEIYSFRDTFRPVNPDNAGELPPNYPGGFSAGVQGPQTLSLEYGDVVRVFVNCTEPYGPGCAMPHPMHLHGHKMAVVAHGRWNEPYDESMIKANPLYRDTVVAHTDGWFVVQFVAKNPGVWRFHCHVNIHHRSGMAMLFDVGGTNEGAMAVRQTPPGLDLCDM